MFRTHTSRRRLLQASAAGIALGQFGLPLHPRAAEPAPLDSYQPVFFSSAEWAFVLAATSRLIPSEGEGPGALETQVPVFIDLQLAGEFGQAADWYMEGPHDAAADPNLGYQSPLTPARIYREAIGAVDQWCRTSFGAPFADLAPERQDEALAALEKNAVPGEAGAGTAAVAGGSPGDAGATQGVPQPDLAPGGGASTPDATAGAEEPATPPASEAAVPPPAQTPAPEAVEPPPDVAILPPPLRDFFKLLLQNTKEGYFADPKYGGNAGMAAWVYIGFPGARAAFTEWATRQNEPYPLGPVSISGERA